MSVIAKMYVAQPPKLFANGKLLNLNCQYDSDLSSASNEDVRFTKASPWGEAQMTIEDGREMPLTLSDQLYLLFDDHEDHPSFENCLYGLGVRCNSMTDFNPTKQVELVGTGYTEDSPVPLGRRIARVAAGFNMRMAIDNPAASIQFVPTKLYWLTIYRAAEYSLDDVLRLARGLQASQA